MKLNKFVGYALLCITLLIACSSKTQSLTPLSTTATILAFGDSLTFGYGINSADSYPAILSSNINRKVINAGVSGEVSTKGLERLPSLLEEHNPDLLILCHGGNDLLRKLDNAKLKSNLLEMIEIAKTYEVEVLLISVPRPSLMLSTLPLYEEVAAESNVPILESTIANILSDRDLKKDTTHPNAKGNLMLANDIQSALEKHGAI